MLSYQQFEQKGHETLMYRFIRKLLWLDRVEPITYKDVDPAPRDKLMENKIASAHSLLVSEIMAVERSSWYIRRELAENALRLVSGRQGKNDR